MRTVIKDEADKFEKNAHDWWNPEGKFRPLHKFNPIRIKVIRDTLIDHFKLNKNSDTPLRKLKILDIGCGGGLLSEPISRLGAHVTGIDAVKKNIDVAKMHAKKMDLEIDYINSSPEILNMKKKFDVILNMEVVEHVSNVDLFIKKCSELIKKNGIMFVATINKNLKSYIFAILGAEYILRWLPIGTHEWDKFLTPQSLETIANKNEFLLNETTGIKFNLILNKWSRSNDTSVNYISTFLKN